MQRPVKTRNEAWRDVARPAKQAYLWVPLADRRTLAYTYTPSHTHAHIHLYAHILYAAPSSQRQAHFGAALTKLFASQLERKQIRQTCYGCVGVCVRICVCVCVCSLAFIRLVLIVDSLLSLLRRSTRSTIERLSSERVSRQRKR